MDGLSASLLDQARVATLATVYADGRPHMVPVVFALDDPDLVTAIDGKPKQGGSLTRIENIGRDPRVTLLAHHYDEDWTRLWWVRVDGRASIEDRGAGFERAMTALKARYPQYESVALAGPVIRIGIGHTTAWEASTSGR